MSGLKSILGLMITRIDIQLAGEGLDFTYYLDVTGDQPFSIREFRAGSKLHTALATFEQQTREALPVRE